MEGDNFIPAQHYAEIENLSQLPAAAVHLSWLSVGDQEGHNQYLQRKEATSVGGKRGIRFMLADMGFMFRGGNWSAASLESLPEPYRLPTHIAERLTTEKLEPAVLALQALNDSSIRECLMDRPEEWHISDEDVQAAIDTVLVRRTTIRDILTAGNPQIFTRAKG